MVSYWLFFSSPSPSLPFAFDVADDVVVDVDFVSFDLIAGAGGDGDAIYSYNA